MCSIFKLLFSPRRYSAWNQFLGFSKYFGSLTDVNGYFGFLADVYRYFRSLADVVGYLILVEFSGIIRSVESGGFLRCGVDINKNLILVEFSKIFR